MNDKSKKFAFASGILFLAAFIAGLYEYVVSLLYTAKAMDTNVFKVLKMIFKNKDSLKLHMLVYALILVLLVLFIAMFTENRAMFFISVLLATGLFAYRMYYWADYTSKYMKNWAKRISQSSTRRQNILLTEVSIRAPENMRMPHPARWTATSWKRSLRTSATRIF